MRDGHVSMTHCASKVIMYWVAAQLLVHREGCEDNRRLARLGPGSLIQVSDVMGRGCAPAAVLFTDVMKLLRYLITHKAFVVRLRVF